MLELYHGTTSVCAQKVRLTLAEKGVEWQSHLLELNGDHLTPEYLQINPNGVCRSWYTTARSSSSPP